MGGGKDKSKGGKASKKGEKKTDTNKLTPVDRTFYELAIGDLNQKLSRLRTHFQTLDETNTNLNEKLIELEEDRIDVSAHLERKLAESQDTISELEERLVEITKVRDKENAEAQEKIRELEARYKAMSDQLTSEIKLLNGKLNSLDEFRVQRDVLLAKFDDQEAELKEKDRSHKETLYNMEQQAIVEKDALKKEVEEKLLQVAEDFTRSSEIRNAGYTRRLIRENIALQKELDATMRAYFDMKRKYDENEERWRAAIIKQTADAAIKDQLIRANKERMEIIEQLTTRFEILQKQYTETQGYKEKYEHLMTRETCERFREIDAAAQKRSLKQRIEHLETERNALHKIAIQQAREIRRMSGIVKQISGTIETAIGTIDVQEQTTTAQITVKLTKQVRENLIGALIEIISRGFTGRLTDKIPIETELLEIPSQLSVIYEPGKMGFMPTTPSPTSTQHKTSKSLVELFKREARILRHSAELCRSGAGSVQAQLLRDNKIIPTAHSFDPKSLLDIEYGAMLYYSMSHDEDIDNLDEKILDLPVNINEGSGTGADGTTKGESGDAAAPGQGEEEETADFDINLFY